MIDFIQNITQKIQKVIFILFYSSSFKNFGKKSTLVFPFRINGAKYISIGKKVHVNEGSWMLSHKISEKDPVIKIGSGSYIGRFVHIVSVNKIDIGDNALIADKVYISDNAHNYKDINAIIKDQDILDYGPVVIGENTWLGENVCVMGASVGKHCVVGANAVVTKDIPNYSIAVGSPAKVIKQYNLSTQKWEKVS
jgi:acetyltransferase-like isoleucine patch superfamily enzyme